MDPPKYTSPSKSCSQAAAGPVISGFQVVDNDGVLVLRGQVTDKDAPVKGLTVVFGGVLAEYDLSTEVIADGTFCDALKIPKGGIAGVATAQTHDSHGVASNLAMDLIIPPA